MGLRELLVKLKDAIEPDIYVYKTITGEDAYFFGYNMDELKEDLDMSIVQLQSFEPIKTYTFSQLSDLNLHELCVTLAYKRIIHHNYPGNYTNYSFIQTV